MARKQVTSSKGRQLKVQQLLIPEIEQLQQQELQAQPRLTINKPVMQIPRPAVKQSPKPKQKTPTNRLEAPYNKPTPRQLPKQHLVSGINPIDNDILKKIKKLYKDDPEGFESDYNLMKERGESPQEWYDQMFDQVSKPRTISSTKSKPTTTPKRSKLELKKQKQEMLDWLNNVRIG
ncbi:hypothetical protein [Prochlorococcus marinus]|uniref:hypothetical protein n=1 Tax=Prochlorococcus marinus TaxID=1219 RepID=UPI0007B3F762|nr:hypothetical protein [Prochlorococcus marinus]KZR73514.1 hypothetical protein PMIT1320_02108 [Prochlorococcus marinus str. MIT 1320]